MQRREDWQKGLSDKEFEDVKSSVDFYRFQFLRDAVVKGADERTAYEDIYRLGRLIAEYPGHASEYMESLDGQKDKVERDLGSRDGMFTQDEKLREENRRELEELARKYPECARADVDFEKWSYDMAEEEARDTGRQEPGRDERGDPGWEAMQEDMAAKDWEEWTRGGGYAGPDIGAGDAGKPVGGVRRPRQGYDGPGSGSGQQVAGPDTGTGSGAPKPARRKPDVHVILSAGRQSRGPVGPTPSVDIEFGSGSDRPAGPGGVSKSLLQRVLGKSVSALQLDVGDRPTAEAMRPAVIERETGAHRLDKGDIVMGDVEKSVPTVDGSGMKSTPLKNAEIIKAAGSKAPTQQFTGMPAGSSSDTGVGVAEPDMGEGLGSGGARPTQRFTGAPGPAPSGCDKSLRGLQMDGIGASQPAASKPGPSGCDKSLGGLDLAGGSGGGSPSYGF